MPVWPISQVISCVLCDNCCSCNQTCSLCSTAATTSSAHAEGNYLLSEHPLYILLMIIFLQLWHCCLLFSNWCHLRLSHVIYQSIIMHFTSFKICTAL